MPNLTPPAPLGWADEMDLLRSEVTALVQHEHELHEQREQRERIPHAHRILVLRT